MASLLQKVIEEATATLPDKSEAELLVENEQLRSRLKQVQNDYAILAFQQGDEQKNEGKCFKLKTISSESWNIRK